MTLELAIKGTGSLRTGVGMRLVSPKNRSSAALYARLVAATKEVLVKDAASLPFKSNLRKTVFLWSVKLVRCSVIALQYLSMNLRSIQSLLIVVRMLGH